MSNKRPKTQLELAFTPRARDEVSKPVGKGTELPVAKREPESPAASGLVMEEVCQPENLKQALQRVRQNKGSPGDDEMTVEELPSYLKEHWPSIREQLLKGTYKPQPVKRVKIPKPGGGMRQLGIPTVLDRFIQQAVLQVLQKRWDWTFSEHSYGFRPGRKAHQAVAQAQRYVAQGYRWVVDIDLEKFFDRVNHDRLMGQVAKRICDKRMLKLLRVFLNAGVMENGLVSPTEEGTPQGGPLSPLLSNLVLDELDRELERRGHCFVRYADDCNIYVRSERAGQRVMESISRFITRKLKLVVNPAKSKVGQPGQCKFLGFRLVGRQVPKRGIAPQVLKRFKQRVRELTRRSRGISLEQMVEQLSRYLRGWRNYYGYCETPSVLRDLDSWVRRRLRSVIWKQWKRGPRRFAELKARGIGKDLAARTAKVSSPWRASRSAALSIAVPNAHFALLGLPSLDPRTAA